MGSNEKRTGLGLLDVVQIIFIVLRCIGVIDWKWWQVLIPLWINLALIVVVAFVEWIKW